MLRLLQTEYKARIIQLFHNLIDSDFFRFVIKELNLEKYKFDIAKSDDFDEILDLYCNQMLNRKKKERGLHFLLDLNKSDLMKQETFILQKMIERGSMFKILNKKNQIVAINGFNDLVHEHDPLQYVHKYNQNFIHFLEICDSMQRSMDKSLKNDKMYSNILKVNRNIQNASDDDIKTVYGKYADWGFGSTLNNYSGKGLMFATLIIIAVISKKLGYSKYVTITNTPSSIRKIKIFKKVTTDNFVFIFNYDNYIFKDGSSIKDYQNKIKTKYNYTKNEIKALEYKIVMMIQQIAANDPQSNDNQYKRLKQGIKLFKYAINNKTKSKL